MKGIKIAIIVGLAVICASCKSSVTDNTPTANGASHELIVSVNQPQWDGAIGDTLRAIFLEPMDNISRTEPLFDMMRIVPTEFKSFIAKHRNVLAVNINPEVSEPTSSAQYDRNAKSQIIVVVSAPDDSTMVSYLSENRESLTALFEKTERDRFLKTTQKYNQKAIGEKIEKMFGFKIDIPRGYTIRNTVGSDFIWISNEYPLASQGFAIYSYPYTGKQDFELDSLIVRRNEFVKNIPGPSDGSYMTTSKVMQPNVDYMRINGRFWAEVTGFWDVENDFMGGPMVSYSTLDTENNRVVTIDGYIFSPKNPQRNMYRELQYMIYSVVFPSNADGSTDDSAK